MKKTIENYFAGSWETFYEKYVGTVKKAGKFGFKALCPFHEDTNPSLSINGATGQFKCFGCDAQGDAFHFYAKLKGLDIKKDFRKILKDIGDDFGISKVPTKKKIVRTYDYKDEADNLLFQEVRLEPKGFFLRSKNEKDRWIKSIEGVKRVPYRLPEVIKADEVLIVEGCKDADNLFNLGFTATTCPMGAKAWKPEYNKYLKGKAVVVIPDNDEAGRKHMEKVADSLIGKVKSLKWIDLPGIPNKGDVSDFIDTFDPKERAVEELCKMIEGAGPYKPRAKRITQFTAAELRSMVFPEPRWAVPDILPEGCNILAGKPKTGKSMMCLNLAIAVATGGLAFGKIPVEKGGVLYLALEDSERRLQERLTTMLRGSPWPENLHFDTEWPRIDNGEIPGLDKRIEEIPDLRLLIIDTLQLIRPAQSGKQKTQYGIDYEDINVIKKLADKYNISILPIHHLRKTQSEDIMDDISGTFGLTGAADGVLALKRQTSKADAELHITGRDIEPQDYALKFHNDLMFWQLLGPVDEVKSTEARQLIHDIIKDAEVPLTPKEIKEITNIPYSTINTILRELIKEDSIEKGIKYGSYKIKL